MNQTLQITNTIDSAPAANNGAVQQSTFLKEVLAGLAATHKYLSSKYFYDAAGDRIFQQIMGCPEYYLTRCELGILQNQSRDIAASLMQSGTEFDIVELGAGDASKTVYLLRQLLQEGADFTYYPVDISTHVIDDLEMRLPQAIPGLSVHGLNGEYLPMLRRCKEQSDRRKVVLFMGANIGNMTPAEAAEFCKELRSELSDDDMLILGIDLVKMPQKILAAYNDAQGFTRDFNLNLLRRMNRELGADFDLAAFEHYPVYDPGTGACRSYLISTKPQTVHIGQEGNFSFAAGEAISMEISQKYSIAQTDELAARSGFRSVQHIVDADGYFLVAVWGCAR